MERRPLGATGLTLPAVGFGASPLGGVFGPVTQSQADAAVRAALDLGIDTFDTAPFYGLGRSEETLGRALKGIPRDAYTLSTKVGRYGARDFDFSTARVRRSIDESLLRLGIDHADILICHDIEYADREQVIGDAIPALRDAVAAGKARCIGFSGLPLSIFPEVLARTEVDVILSYCHATLSDDTLLPLIPTLGAVGVINASPLGMGLLTDAGPPDWHPAPTELKAACAAAAAHCRAKGTSIAALALAWSVRQSGIAMTLVGMADVDTVRANAAAAAAEPDPTLLAEVAEILAPVQGLTWPSP